jgi:hypothetical protein
MPSDTSASTMPMGALLDDLSNQDEDGQINDSASVMLEEHDSDIENYVGNDDPENDAIHTLYDLISLEGTNLNKPMFTRIMINCMDNEVAVVLSEQQKPPSERNLQTLSRPYADHQTVNL